MNPNDQIRRAILQYFYDRNANATSRQGKKGAAVKMSDLKKDLKTLHSFSQTQVVSNLTYLIDRKWVNRFDVTKTVIVRGGTIPSTVTWYEISATGIDKIEGGSEFEPKDRYAGININASGSNVITLGDGNIVQPQFKELHESLNKLKEAIVESDKLDDKEKLNAASDLETLKDLLVKEEPDPSIVGKLWSGAEKAATVAGAIDLVAKATPLITKLLGR